jgi:hypothetical protein
MRAQTYYTLDTDDQIFAKRLGESLNMIRFVFTHHPELRIIKKDERKKTDGDNPHGRIFNGNPFTAEQLHAWSVWVDKVVASGRESIALQHPAYRTGHAMALDRFRAEADDFLAAWKAAQ